MASMDAASYWRSLLSITLTRAKGELGQWMALSIRNRSGTMSDEARDRFEIPKQMRSMAEASFDQARKAFEKFLAGAQQTAGSIEERGATVRAGAKDISAKALSQAEKLSVGPGQVSRPEQHPARVSHAALHLKLHCIAQN